MAFRVLITGGRNFTDYPALRAALDTLLANRLPDVELLTTGGRGVPMLAASYAAERGLTVTPFVPEFGRFPAVAAVERRDASLVSDADAVVVVWDGRDETVRRVRELAERRGGSLHVIGGPSRKPTAVRPLPAPAGHKAKAGRASLHLPRIETTGRTGKERPGLRVCVARRSGRDHTVPAFPP